MANGQPVWKMVANLGDANPFEYGGSFVYIDETGVYPPEVERLELERPDSRKSKYTIYRYILEPCTYINGILSDNPYHPEHPAWFAGVDEVERPQDSTHLSGIASCCGVEMEELAQMFCSEDVLERALAWEMVGDYHGFENLDEYPLTHLTRKEVEERYEEDMKTLPR